MANVHDVAAYILAKKGQMTAMKLQKLVYYSKAWHLVWDSSELFPEPVQAWANGPVVYDLYANHRGMFVVDSWKLGDPSNLTPSERGSVDAVLSFYGDKLAYELSELTHSERPWKDARKGLSPGERSNAEITSAAMYEYYDGLVGLGEDE
jgi:uncharacterized phage-associated protein